LAQGFLSRTTKHFTIASSWRLRPAPATMQFSLQAFCFLLFCCSAQPAVSVSTAGTWPWSRRAPKAPPAPEPLPAARSADADALAGRPGCWMRMPSGCPKKPMDTQKWRHDAWAEQKGLDEAGCQGRTSMWNGFCGSQDAVMAFVPAQQGSQDSQDANTTQAQDSQNATEATPATEAAASPPAASEAADPASAEAHEELRGDEGPFSAPPAAEAQVSQDANTTQAQDSQDKQ